MSPNDPVRVAVVQAAPACLNLEASVRKAVDLIAQAARQGARVVAFPEVWLPGYPWWIWLDGAAWAQRSGLSARYLEQAFRFDSAACDAIAQAAAEHRIVVLMGVAEQEDDRLFITQWLVDETGRTLFRRRKLKPGPLEMQIFSEGGAHDLPVVDSSAGRIGALACAEHRHPLLKHAMHLQHEFLHVASWPGFPLVGIPNMSSPETFLAISRTYAVEGGCYVLAPCALVNDEMRALVCDTPAKADQLRPGGGHAQIYAPNGDALCEPLAPEAEGLLLADLFPSAVHTARRAFDLAGHSSRADVIRLAGPASPLLLS